MNKKTEESAEKQTNIAIPIESAERFFETFEKSARRWEMIVYPGMFVVVMFMAYGFYLIYNITNDMRAMVNRFDDPEITTNLGTLSNNLQALNTSIAKMARRVDDMATDTAAMSKSTISMTKHMQSMKFMKSMDIELKKMNQSVFVMNHSVKQLGVDMSRMRYDMTAMNRSVSRPLNMMNKFIPF